MLTFDPAAHVYTWKGARVPSVTEIIGAALGDAFGAAPEGVLEYAKARGRAVHRACELDSRGELDEATVAPEIAPYLEAWRAFRRNYPFNVVASERPLYHQALGFAGTPDVICESPAWWAVIDIKSGLGGLRAQLQTAAYLEMAREHYKAVDGKPARRFVLRLQANGRPALVECKRAGDWRDFLSCLNVYRLRQQEAA